MHLDLGYRTVTIDGLTLHAHPVTGRVYPEIRGGDGPDDAGKDEPKTFTQDELDRIVGRARSEAKNAAAKDLATELGCTVEEAKAKIAAASAAEDAAKTDAQRDREAAAAEKAEAEADRRKALEERFAAKVERKLTAAGVDDKALARAARLVTLEPDADDDAIAAEIEALKADVPGLFTTDGREVGNNDLGDKGKGTKPAPKRQRTDGGTPKTMADVGREALAAAGITPRTAA